MDDDLRCNLITEQLDDYSKDFSDDRIERQISLLEGLKEFPIPNLPKSINRILEKTKEMYPNLSDEELIDLSIMHLKMRIRSN